MEDKGKNDSVHGIKKLELLLEKRWAAYTMAACCAVVLFLALSHLNVFFSFLGSAYQFISPVISGIVIAYLINPMVNLLEQKIFINIKKEKTRHTISVILSLCIIILLIILLLGALIPSIAESFTGIASNMDSYITAIQKYLTDFAHTASKFNLDLSILTSSWEKVLNEIMKTLSSHAGTIVSASYSIGASAVNLLISFILAVYFLIDKQHLITEINKLRHLLLSDKSYERRTLFWRRCHKILGQYIIYDILDGILVGAVNAIFMLITGMPYVALISVIVGITNLLPTFGPVFGAAIGGIILVLTKPVQALIFLIFTVILQFFDGYILKPKMFGGSLGVPAVWILITIIVGGKMFGFVGILLAIPFTAIFTFIYDETILPWLQQRKENRTQKNNND